MVILSGCTGPIAHNSPGPTAGDASTETTAQDAGMGDRPMPVDGARDTVDATGPAAGTLVWRLVTGAPYGGNFWPSAMWGGGGELYVGWDRIHHRSAAGTWTSGTVADNRFTLQDLSIWGSGPNDIYAGALNRGVTGLFHSTGDDAWKLVTLPEPSGHILSVWGFSAEDVYAASGERPIFRLQQGVWKVDLYGTNSVLGFWGSSPTDVYALASVGGRIWRKSGTGTWRIEGVPTSHVAVRIWGSGPGDVYTLYSPYNENMGPAMIMHSTGKGDWTTQLTLTNVDRLYDIWGSGPDNVYVTGSRGAGTTNRPVIFHTTGDGVWKEVPAPPVTVMLSLWGSGPGDVYIGAAMDLNPMGYGGALYNGRPN